MLRVELCCSWMQLGGFPRTLRYWEAAGLVAKLSSPGTMDTSAMESQLGGLCIRTIEYSWTQSELRTSVSILTRKSMPTVEMKVPARKAPSLKRTSRQVFPTPESPTSMT